MNRMLLCVVLLLTTQITVAQSKKIDSLFNIATNGATDTNNTKAYILLSEIYKNIQVDSAELLAQKGIDLAQQRKQLKMEAYGHNAMGYAKYYKGD
ncbi:MAG TPA: hypothetical protein PKC41_10790, partial [Chitinophagaceae bacterium]|nr:hypothetical protein [Chitinophagaceae bacterium]